MTEGQGSGLLTKQGKVEYRQATSIIQVKEWPSNQMSIEQKPIESGRKVMSKKTNELYITRSPVRWAMCNKIG